MQYYHKSVGSLNMKHCTLQRLRLSQLLMRSGAMFSYFALEHPFSHSLNFVKFTSESQKTLKNIIIGFSQPQIKVCNNFPDYFYELLQGC